ncbi:MAG: hypothetical protein R2695_17895 [Acidimicrobiales bacterium]
MGEGGHRRFRGPQPNIRVADQEPVRLADREWFAVHTPGHTIDHLCLFDPEEGSCWRATTSSPPSPHIAGSTEVTDPLATFFARSTRSPLGGPHVRCSRPTVTRSPISSAAAPTSASTTTIASNCCGMPRLRTSTSRSRPGCGCCSRTVVGRDGSQRDYAHLEHLRVTGEAVAAHDGGLLRFSLPT